MENLIPKLGEIKRASEAGYKDPSHFVIWLACSVCGRQRWVHLRKGNPETDHCAEHNGGNGHGPKPRPLEERFWSHVNKTDTCWLWTGCCDPYGYGRFSIHRNGPAKLAHLFAYELLVGPVPEGLELDHLCRVHSCVNPAHFEPVTHVENCRRGLGGKVNHHSSAKTHCPQGHPYDEVNTYVNPRGARYCRICAREQAIQYRIRKALKP